MPKYFDAKRFLGHKSAVMLLTMSGRMTGKSVQTLHELVKYSYNNNRQFIYLDLKDSQANTLDRRNGIFAGHNAVDWANQDEPDLQVYYWNKKFYVIEKWDDKKTFIENIRAGQLVGYFHILEDATDIKSIEFPEVDYVLIDEFSDKIKAFSDFQHAVAHYVSTIFRGREWGQLILLGNAADARNPILNMLNLDGSRIKQYIDRKPFSDGMFYIEIFTAKGQRNGVFDKQINDIRPIEYPPNGAGDERAYAEKLAYALQVDLDNVETEVESTFTADNIVGEARESVDLMIEGKGEYLSFTQLPKTMLVQSTRPRHYKFHAFMDTTLNNLVERKNYDRYVNSERSKLFEDVNAKQAYLDIGGK